MSMQQNVDLTSKKKKKEEVEKKKEKISYPLAFF